jgi:hypothetical protein
MFLTSHISKELLMGTPSKTPDPKAPAPKAEPERQASVTGKGPAPRFGKAHHIRNYKH